MSRRAPRPLAAALGTLEAELVPASTLARAQVSWRLVVGPVIAANTAPVFERDGVLTVSCVASVWAQELDLMGPELIARVNAHLGPDTIRKLRLQAV